MVTVVVCEKPNVANKVKAVISGPDIVIVSARGHLLEVNYPSADRKWYYPIIAIPADLVLTPLPQSRGVLDTIVNAALKADVLVSATDLDREGSSIFYEIYMYIKSIKPSFNPTLKRLEVSALTPGEIKKGWANLKDYDWGRSYAGYTRNLQDMQWGVNLTRAMTLACQRYVYKSGVKSGGRVQSPMLKLIADRDREIGAFKPEPYYQITVTMRTPEGKEFEMLNDFKCVDDAVVKSVQALVKAGAPTAASVMDKKQSIPPPAPFSGTAVQIEGARALGFTAKEIADRSSGLLQHLYISGLTSYPGTDSERYPKWSPTELADFKAILQGHTGIAPVRAVGIEGRKEDAAHPCIHPVARLTPSNSTALTAKEIKLYDLITRRCAAGFLPDAVDAVKTVKASLDRYPFKAAGRAELDKGWRAVYPFIKNTDKPIPDVKNGAMLVPVKCKAVKKQTAPPPRYNPITLIAQCERLGLGTKNTRPAIIDKLISRGYVMVGKGKGLESTPEGRAVIEILDRFAASAASNELTNLFNAAMDAMEQSGQLGVFNDRNITLIRALDEILDKFKKNESEIGRILSNTGRSSQFDANLI